MSSQLPPEPTVSAAAWEPGPDTRVFSGTTLNAAIATARLEQGPHVEIRSARRIKQGLRGRTRFEVLAVVTDRPGGGAGIARDRRDALPDLLATPTPPVPAQQTPPPALTDPNEAVSATLAAMLADVDDREAGGLGDSDQPDFAADLARQISERSLDPAFRTEAPPFLAETLRGLDEPAPTPAADASAEARDPHASEPDPTFTARVRAALRRVTLEPEESVGDGPHPDLDLLDPQQPAASPRPLQTDYQEQLFPRPRASESSRGLPDLATAGAPPGSLPQTAPAPSDSSASDPKTVQPWQVRALDLTAEPPPSRVSARSRQQQAATQPDISQRVFRTDPPATAAAAPPALSSAPETPSAVPVPQTPVVPAVLPPESPADVVERVVPRARRTRPAPRRPVPTAGARDGSEASPLETPASLLAGPEAGTHETPASLVGWSRGRLTRLGLPREIVTRLPALEPVDDLGWLRALRVAIEAVIKPAGPDADTSAVVNGTGAASAIIILRAAVAGATPGTLTTDGRTVPASATELALAVRSCVVS